MLDYTYATYRGSNLSALAADILKIGAPVGTITHFKVKVHANVADDIEFTVKRNGSSLTTVAITTGADQGTSATISQASTEDDELVLDLTDYTSGTIQAPITLYVFYTRSVEASTTEQLTGTEAAKFSTPDSVAALWEKGSDIASAATISIGEGGFFHVTGTTTITDIDPATDKTGREFCLVFDGALTLTHHSTTLILPTGANIVTAAGDCAYFRSEGSDAVRCVVYQRKSGAALVAGSLAEYTPADATQPGSLIFKEDTDNGTNKITVIAPAAIASDKTQTLQDATGTIALTSNLVGKNTIWIPASAMIPATTNGPAVAQLETATNKQNYSVLDFDASTDESAHFQIAMPKGWNEGTITFQVYWSSTATDTDGVAWALEAGSYGDNEAIDAAFGTPIVVTDDCQGAAGEVYITAESSALTIAGSPAAGDICFFRFFRDVSDANDDATEDARLIGIKLYYTTDALTDD